MFLCTDFARCLLGSEPPLDEFISASLLEV